MGDLKNYGDYINGIVVSLLGLYGQLWVGAMEFLSDLADDFMRLKSAKLPYFQRGLRVMRLIQSTL